MQMATTASISPHTVCVHWNACGASMGAQHRSCCLAQLLQQAPHLLHAEVLVEHDGSATRFALYDPPEAVEAAAVGCAQLGRAAQLQQQGQGVRHPQPHTKHHRAAEQQHLSAACGLCQDAHGLQQC